MIEQRFATAITCIDGRTHFPVRQWLEEHFDVDYVDRVTEPGVDLILAEGTAADIAALREKATLSVTAHDSHLIVVVGHHDCAANPVAEEIHRAQIQRALEAITAWALPVTAYGLWLNAEWEIEVIGKTEYTVRENESNHKQRIEGVEYATV